MIQNGLRSFILSLLFLFNVASCEKPVLKFCDDGKKGIEIDLHGEVDWKCMENEKWNLEDIPETQPSMNCYKEYGSHVCIKDPIDILYPADHIPVMGPHRQVWAEYGEYKYCPPGRYVHNLEHGGIVYMYHPCASDYMVNQLRFIAKSCTWKYVITAFSNLTKEFPVAVLSYGCIYKMSRINVSDVRDWVQMQIGRSPEADVFGQGKYDYNLIEASKVPDNMSNVDCIQLNLEMATTTQKTPKKRDTTVSANVGGKVKTVYNSSVIHIQEESKTPRTEEAAWAIGSLLFLICSVIFGLCYSQLLRSDKKKTQYENAKILNQGKEKGLNVAAIVRKFPHVLKSVGKKGYVKNQSSNEYKLIEDDISCSEDEIL